jgi:hypothetical protein
LNKKELLLWEILSAACAKCTHHKDANIEDYIK